jgi:hypothetical protein
VKNKFGPYFCSWPAWLTLALLNFAFTAYPANYLRSVMPTPLRWYKSVPVRPEILLLLPPLGMGDDPSAAGSSTPLSAGTAASTSSTTNAPAAAAVQFAPGASETVTGPVLPLPPEALSALLYSPTGTNHPPSAVVPLQFVPPPVPFLIQRSSSATYSTDKP